MAIGLSSERPSQRGDPQQFALDHLGGGLELGRKGKGFPGALVVGHDHAGLRRDVFQAFDLVADAADDLGQPDGETVQALTTSR